MDTKLASALVKARSEIRNPPRTRQGMFKGHRYAGLEDCLDAINPILTGCGLTFCQDIQTVNNGVRAITVIIHESGAEHRFKGPWIPVGGKKDAHAFASATTYSKRYSLFSTFGIEGDPDLDAKDAVAPPQPPVKDIEGVDESGMDELAVKRMYSEQINRLNAAAKDKDVDRFCTEWTRIPEADRIGVHGACLSHVRTFLKKPEVMELNREIEESFGQTALTQEDLI